jgi:Uma2 family endonuclease
VYPYRRMVSVGTLAGMATARPDAPRKVTAAEFLKFPDDFPPHSQLVQGHVVVNEPSDLHQRICGFLYLEIGLWCRGGPDRGEVMLPIDVPINEWNVFAPDLSWYAERRNNRSAPDLAIEVRSPSTWRYDIGPKFARYQASGLAELWLVDTVAHVVLAYRRSSAEREFDIALEIGEDDSLTSPLLPGLEIGIRELFDR